MTLGVLPSRGRVLMSALIILIGLFSLSSLRFFFFHQDHIGYRYDTTRPAQRPAKASNEQQQPMFPPPLVSGACLQIAMPTVSRPNGAVYVVRTVEAIAREFVGSGLCADIHLMNGEGPSHAPAFNTTLLGEARVTVHTHYMIRVPQACDNIRDPKCLLHKKVFHFGPSKRQQLMNFAQMTLQLVPVCVGTGPRAAEFPWFLLMEDDFEWCPGALRSHISRVLSFVWEQRADPKLRGARISVGLNGLLLKCEDLPRMYEGLFFALNKVPVDYLLGSLFGASAARIYTYRYNTMKHLGDQSTVGNHATLYSAARFGRHGAIPACGEILTQHITLPPEEEFKLAPCCTSLFSPCNLDNEKYQTSSLGFLDKNPLAADDHTVYPFSSATNQDCHDACSAKGMVCNAAGASQINNCAVATTLFNCEGSCGISQGVELPAFREDESQPITTLLFGSVFGARVYGTCMLSSCLNSVFSCEAKHVNSQRICPCSMPKGRI